LLANTVLGKIFDGAATSAAKAGGNTGTGTLVLDVTTPVLANAIPGVYQVRCIAAATDAGLFNVTDPNGNLIGQVNAAITTGTVFSDQIKFALLTIHSADFVVGDGFDVT